MTSFSLWFHYLYWLNGRQSASIRRLLKAAIRLSRARRKLRRYFLHKLRAPSRQGPQAWPSRVPRLQGHPLCTTIPRNLGAYDLLRNEGLWRRRREPYLLPFRHSIFVSKWRRKTNVVKGMLLNIRMSIWWAPKNSIVWSFALIKQVIKLMVTSKALLALPMHQQNVIQAPN